MAQRGELMVEGGTTTRASGLPCWDTPTLPFSLSSAQALVCSQMSYQCGEENDLHVELLEKNRGCQGACYYLPRKSQFGALGIWPHRNSQLLTSRDEIKLFLLKKIIIVKNSRLVEKVTIYYRPSKHSPIL